MNLFQKFLAKLGGAHITTLEQCPTEISKYVSIGLTILFTGVFASLSGGYAIYKVFYPEGVEHLFLNAATAMGLIWGFMILNLDRFIVMSIKKRNNKFKEFFTAIPRIILAIIISLVVAKPLEIRLFQDRIEAQIMDSELFKMEEHKDRIEGITDKDAITNMKDGKDAEVKELESLLGNDCPTQKCKYAFKAQDDEYKKYRNLKSQLQPKINDAELNINFINNGDKHKQYIYTIEGVLRTELTDEGKRLLIEYQNEKNRLITKRQGAFGKYDKKKKEYQRLNTEYKDKIELELNGARLEAQDLKEQKNVADSTATVMKEESNAAVAIAYTDNFITQIEALGELTKWQEDETDENSGLIINKANNAMWYMNWAIIILFIVIETAPIFVKLVSSKGPYDIALEASETERASQFIHAANTVTSKAEQENYSELQALMNMHQVQINVVQAAAQKWFDKKQAELNNGMITDEEYREFIQKVIDFEIIDNKNIVESYRKSKEKGRFRKFISNAIEKVKLN